MAAPDQAPWDPGGDEGEEPTEEEKEQNQEEPSQEEAYDHPAPVLTALKARLEAKWSSGYAAGVEPTHVHREASGGQPLTLGHLPRRDATTIHCLRLGRAHKLQGARKKMALAPDDTCPQCGKAPETTIHYLLHCPRWDKERKEAFGSETLDTTILQRRPDLVAEYLHRCGR